MNIPIFYNLKQNIEHHHLTTYTKAKWIRESLASAPISNTEVIDINDDLLALTREAIGEVHDASYLANYAQSHGSEKAEFESAVASTQALVEAAIYAYENKTIAGCLSSGLHHARRAMANGFCIINGLAVASQLLQDKYGAGRILILDFDAHCGGGTASLIEDKNIYQLDIAVNAFDSYSSQANAKLMISGEAEYLSTIQGALASLMANDFAFCFYNAGMDPFSRDHIGGAGISIETLKTRERLVFQWLKQHEIPSAFCLAGGYSEKEDLVKLHRLTIEAAADRGLQGWDEKK